MILRKSPFRMGGWRMLVPFVTLLLLAAGSYAQDRILTVSGKITDELDKPLTGASIRIAHTTIATATNKDGGYSIKVNPADSLEFTYTGYRIERMAVRNRVDLNVKMTPIAGSMDEVTVIGYGQQKKVSVVGSQATVTPEDLKLPARDIASMLAGRISGIITTSRGGGPSRNLSNNAGNVVRPAMYIRLAELYLNYAEALNESDPSNPDILVHLNAIRTRGGIPALSAGLSQAEMRKQIQVERCIEMAYEGCRFFDVRRWKIANTAEGKQGGDFTGMNVFAGTGLSDPTFYTKTRTSTRIWDDKYYIFPVPQSELNKNFSMVQAPGY